MHAWTKFFDVLNWLVVYGDKYDKVSVNSAMVMMGWGDDNGIDNYSSNAWIVWWKSNVVSAYASGSVIGWWESNTVDANWENSIIAWGNWNTAWNGGVVVWWGSNQASHKWSVVLWWESNISNWENSLLLWVNSKWGKSSFVWNDSDNVNVGNDSAYVGASNGILIWTYNSKTNVNLVVEGPIQFSWRNNIENVVGWEIMEKNWCFYGYDGEKWYILGKIQPDGCKDSNMNISGVCKFGKMLLHEWDKVKAYSKPYDINCESVRKEVECKWWQLLAWDSTDYVYSYCYNVSNDQKSLIDG